MNENVKVLVAQMCLILCDPMDWIPPGSSVHGILHLNVLNLHTIEAWLEEF